MYLKNSVNIKFSPYCLSRLYRESSNIRVVDGVESIGLKDLSSIARSSASSQHDYRQINSSLSSTLSLDDGVGIQRESITKIFSQNEFQHKIKSDFLFSSVVLQRETETIFGHSRAPTIGRAENEKARERFQSSLVETH